MKNKRRNPLSDLGEEPVSSLAHRPSDAKRNREWEREHDDVVTYRAEGLKAVNVRVKRYAHKHGIATVGEAARIVLEAGLAALE